jgi:hypothetical protein
MLLVLDRMDDPVTPLLSQWTYQAMVHELLGLNRNRVVLKGAPGVRQDLEEVVLSSTQDKFFLAHRHANYGDLGGAIKSLLDGYQRDAKMNEQISSVGDMQSFMERYPAFRSQAHNVSKHVALMSELSRLVEVCKLMDVSALEQELACNDDHAAQHRELLDKVRGVETKAADKLRLALLYALRYEGGLCNLEKLKRELIDAGLLQHKVDLLDLILRHGGKARRAPGLYGDGSIISRMAKNLKTGLTGVENVSVLCGGPLWNKPHAVGSCPTCHSVQAFRSLRGRAWPRFDFCAAGCPLAGAGVHAARAVADPDAGRGLQGQAARVKLPGHGPDSLRSPEKHPGLRGGRCDVRRSHESGGNEQLGHQGGPRWDHGAQLEHLSKRAARVIRIRGSNEIGSRASVLRGRGLSVSLLFEHLPEIRDIHKAPYHAAVLKNPPACDASRLRRHESEQPYRVARCCFEGPPATQKS